jgi:hypothetical protein
MTRPSVHALLAEFHKLLSSYQSSDFLDASKYVGTSGPLRDALRALAREAPVERQPNAPIQHRQEGKARNTRKSGRNGQRDSTTLLAAIRRSPYFKSTAAMADFAHSMGLDLTIRAKESRDRVARRLVALINKLPEGEKDRLIDDFLAKKNNQTQGWIDVIRNP